MPSSASKRLQTSVPTLPRLGSRVRIPSPAPNRLQHQPRKPMVQRLSAISIRYIAGSAPCRGRKPGTAEGPSFEALSRRVACRFRWRSHQKAAFASGDFIDVRLPSRDGAQSKVAGTIHVPLQELAQSPSVLDAAIWIPQSCWDGGLAGARCLRGKVGRMHQDSYLSLSQNY